jgi:hypothetical protein
MGRPISSIREANVDMLLFVMQMNEALRLVLGEWFPHFGFLALKSPPEIN